MGRPKRKEEFFQRHIRLSRETNDFVEAEVQRRGKSYNEIIESLLKRAAKQKAAKYSGFKEIVMSYDFTCFECQETKKAGKLAMYDSETGAAMCMDCAIDGELTTRAAAKLVIHQLQLKRNIKALKIEEKIQAEKFLEEHLERTASLQELELLEKLPKLIEDARNRQTTWMRYHNQDYEVEGKKERAAFEEFRQHDDDIIAFLNELRKIHEEAMKTREKLLLERVLKEKKKKKAEQIAT